MIHWKISKSHLDPRILQQLDRSGALVLLHCEHALDQPLRWLGDPPLVAVFHFPCRDEAVEFLLVAGSEGKDSHQHEVEQYSQRPYVCLCSIVGTLLDYLRAHVGWSAAEIVEQGLRVRAESKIDYLHVPPFIY